MGYLDARISVAIIIRRKRGSFLDEGVLYIPATIQAIGQECIYDLEDDER